MQPRYVNDFGQAVDQFGMVPVERDQSQPKKKGGGLLSALLPTIGGTLGAVGGTFLGGPVGTVAGGAAGSGFGEFLRQQIEGEEANIGTVGREALFGAIPGGLGLAAKGVKGVKAGMAGAKAVGGATDATTAVTRPAPSINTPAFMRQGKALPTDMTEIAAGKVPLSNTANRPGADVQKQLEGLFNNGQYDEAQKLINTIPDADLKAGMQSTLNAIGPKVASPSTSTTIRPTGFTNKVKQDATNRSQEGFGLTVGQGVPGGRVLTPDKADTVQAFITGGAQKYGGIRPGKPISQARDAQNVLNNVTRELDTTLSNINRSVTPDEIASIASSIRDRVGANALVTKTSNTANKLVEKVGSAKNLQELEAIRREADNIAFTATGAKKTSAAAQAKEVRDAIDDFITPLSPDYKAIKGDYQLAKDALEFTSKANKNAKGFKIPFVDVEVGKQSIPGAHNIAAAKVAGATTPQARPGGFRPFIKPALQQGGTRLASAGLLGTPLVGSPQEEQPQDAALLNGESLLDQEAMAPAQPSRSQQLFESAIKYMQETGDIKGTQTIAGLAEQAAAMEKATGGANKPLSAEASKLVANAESGLTSLQQLQGMLQQDPSIQGKSALSSTFDPFGATSAALGTSSYENAKNNIADVITRLRTGAALTESEEAFYKRQLPQPFDPPETVQQKLAMFNDLFQRVSGTGRLTTDADPSQALSGAF